VVLLPPSSPSLRRRDRFSSFYKLFFLPTRDRVTFPFSFVQFSFPVRERHDSPFFSIYLGGYFFSFCPHREKGSVPAPFFFSATRSPTAVHSLFPCIDSRSSHAAPLPPKLLGGWRLSSLFRPLSEGDFELPQPPFLPFRCKEFFFPSQQKTASPRGRFLMRKLQHESFLSPFSFYSSYFFFFFFPFPVKTSSSVRLSFSFTREEEAGMRSPLPCQGILGIGT